MGMTRRLTGQMIRDKIVNLPDGERTIVLTNAISGQFKIIYIQKDNLGNLNITSDPTPEV